MYIEKINSAGFMSNICFANVKLLEFFYDRNSDINYEEKSVSN